MTTEPEPSTGPRTPKINARLLCERVIREDVSGQVSVLGTYEVVNASQFPTALQSTYLCVKLTEAQGDYVFKLEMVRRDDMKTVGEATLPSVNLKGPLEHSELVFHLIGVPLPQPGHYDFRLWANGRFVDSKSLHVRLTPVGAQPAGADPSGMSIRIAGSTVIARIPNFALKAPRPAE